MSLLALIKDTARGWVSSNALVGSTFCKLLNCISNTETSIVEYSSHGGFKQIFGMITRFANSPFNLGKYLQTVHIPSVYSQDLIFLIL